jgi:putative phosphoesterase
MLVGIFSDTHDHLDNIRRVVALFNERGCACVLFAGDLVSTFAVPPLRELQCPLYGCFGDNEGNKIGLRGGLRVIGEIGEPPAAYTLTDGTRAVIAHMERQLAGYADDFDIAVYGHTHRPAIRTDERGRLFINPGETSGWTFGAPSVALLETTTRTAKIVPLDTSIPLPSWNAHRRGVDSSAGASPPQTQ